MSEEKMCSKCKLVKPLHEFYKSSGNKDGRAYYCRTCYTIKNRQYFVCEKGYITIATPVDLLRIANIILGYEGSRYKRFIVTGRIMQKLNQQIKIRPSDEKYLFTPFTVKPKEQMDFEKVINNKKHWAA